MGDYEFSESDLRLIRHSSCAKSAVTRDFGLYLLDFAVDYGVGQTAQHSRAQLPSASVIIVLMVRAHRPHSALHPRHP